MEVSDRRADAAARRTSAQATPVSALLPARNARYHMSPKKLPAEVTAQERVAAAMGRLPGGAEGGPPARADEGVPAVVSAAQRQWLESHAMRRQAMRELRALSDACGGGAPPTVPGDGSGGDDASSDAGSHVSEEARDLEASGIDPLSHIRTARLAMRKDARALIARARAAVGDAAPVGGPAVAGGGSARSAMARGAYGPTAAYEAALNREAPHEAAAAAVGAALDDEMTRCALQEALGARKTHLVRARPCGHGRGEGGSTLTRQRAHSRAGARLGSAGTREGPRVGRAHHAPVAARQYGQGVCEGVL